MRDILPAERARWRQVEERAHHCAARHGFEEIETPIIESAMLIERGVGESSDAGGKELYRLQPMTEASVPLVLRPEATAGVVRAYHEGHLGAGGVPVRLYSLGSMFRHDRPQAGRYRQFHQFNVEVLGEGSGAIDADLIELGWEWLAAVGLEGVGLELNSIGDESCRPAYLDLLRAYYRPLQDQLHPDCRRRLEESPLRLLDCKEAGCVALKARAPRITDHLCADCARSLAEVRELLQGAGVPHRVNPYLVRGLDYYTRTVFEFQRDNDEGAQSALGGGGRYDGLSAALGFADTPGSGFAMGLERIIANLPGELGGEPRPPLDLLVLIEEGVVSSAGAEVARRARQRVAAAADASPRSLKAKMRSASRAGVRWVALIAAGDVEGRRLRLRDMVSGEQRELDWDQLPEALG